MKKSPEHKAEMVARAARRAARSDRQLQRAANRIAMREAIGRIIHNERMGEPEEVEECSPSPCDGVPGIADDEDDDDEFPPHEYDAHGNKWVNGNLVTPEQRYELERRAETTAKAELSNSVTPPRHDGES